MKDAFGVPSNSLRDIALSLASQIGCSCIPTIKAVVQHSLKTLGLWVHSPQVCGSLGPVSSVFSIFVLYFSARKFIYKSLYMQ